LIDYFDHTGSGWIYFVPYEDNINAALKKLRRHVFESGEYYAPFTKAQMMADLTTSIQRASSFPDPEVAAGMQAEFKAHLAQLSSLPVATTIEQKIEEALILYKDMGTRSILDIRGVSTSPESGKAYPLPFDVLKHIVGSEKPSQEMVRQCELRFMESIPRWRATYFAVYKNGVRDQICFVGFTGD